MIVTPALLDPPPVLAGEPFQMSLLTMQLAGRVEEVLHRGYNPLTDHEARCDLERLLNDASSELSADVTAFMRAATVEGATADGLAPGALRIVQRHGQRTLQLLEWLQDLGIPAERDRRGFVRELVLAIAGHVEPQSPSIHSPAFDALAMALWRLFFAWQKRAVIVDAPNIEPRGDFTALDLLRLLELVLGWCNRSEAFRYWGVGPLYYRPGTQSILLHDELPLRLRREPVDLSNQLHRLNSPHGFGVPLLDSPVLVTDRPRLAVAGHMLSNGDGRDNRLTVEQANAKAAELAQADPSFLSSGMRQWAALIGCSVGTVARLPLWQENMERSGRKRKGKAPRVVSLTDKLQTTIADPDEELKRLTAQQKSDFEPSPLEANPPGPRRMRRERKP